MNNRALFIGCGVAIRQYGSYQHVVILQLGTDFWSTDYPWLGTSSAHEFIINVEGVNVVVTS